MRHFFRPFVALLLCAGYAPAQQPPLRIEAADAQQVSAAITYEIGTKNFAASKWMLFLPEPPELASQKGVRVSAEPAGKLVKDKSLLGRPVRYVEVRVARPTPGAGVAMKLDVEATLRSRRLVPLAPWDRRPAAPALTASQRKYYLAPSTNVDFDSAAFRQWLDEKRIRPVRVEDPLDFAARVLEVIRADYAYRYEADEDKRASVVCRAKATDCAGMCYLFAGAMRAGGVPARLLVGRVALPRRPGSKPSDTDHDRPHVRAEFFVEGIGWVPVDPAQAHGAKRRPVSAYIGNDPGDMLVLHLDVDLKLPFPDKVRECQFLQIGPYYWTSGRGDFDAYFGPSGWELKKTPVRER